MVLGEYLTSLNSDYNLIKLVYQGVEVYSIF